MQMQPAQRTIFVTRNHNKLVVAIHDIHARDTPRRALNKIDDAPQTPCADIEC